MAKRIFVVGGGIAGLTAAYTLQKYGFDVEVLERDDTAGGRMRANATATSSSTAARSSSRAVIATCAHWSMNSA